MDSMESHTNNCAGQKPNCVSPSSLLPPPPLPLPRFPSLIQIKEKNRRKKKTSNSISSLAREIYINTQ
jgi:hypothetical protein